MRLTPMDVQRQTFPTRLRGYDVDEVRQYLSLVADELAELQQARDAFERDAATLRMLVDEHQRKETILKNTLITAQRVSEEMRDTGRKQAETVVKEAELKADRLLGLAQSRAADIEKDILQLRERRASVRADIRSLIDRLGHLLDLEEEAERGENLVIMPKAGDRDG